MVKTTKETKKKLYEPIRRGASSLPPDFTEELKKMEIKFPYPKKISENKYEINRFCTTVEQSKKLAEFLPITSADLWYAERYAGQVLESGKYVVEDTPNYYLSLTRPSESNYSQDVIKDVPCWSLDALLSIFTDETTIRVSSLKNGDRIYSCDSYEYGTPAYENAIDAAVDMVMEMHKENLI